jgi:hypothetical protein
MTEEHPPEDSMTEGYRRPSQVTDWLFILASIALFIGAWQWSHLSGWLILAFGVLSIAKVLEPIAFAAYWATRR